MRFTLALLLLAMAATAVLAKDLRLYDEDEDVETTTQQEETTTVQEDTTTTDPDNGIGRISSGAALLVSIVMCLFRF